MVIHRQIGIIPVAGDAQPLEFLTLDIHPTGGKGAAFLTEINDINRVFVQTFGAVLLFYFPLDRQTMAIPTGHIARIAAHHLLAAHHHILQHFVQGMADVQMPVGIGRAIVQGKGRAGFAGGFGAQAVIDADFLPTVQPERLARGQACAHRETGFGQKHGIAVVGIGIGGCGFISAHFCGP